MIDIDKLQFTYNNGFNLYIKKLDIKKGDIVSIIGPNGAGKSTLIKIISKIIKNYTGKIMIENKELSNYSYKELSRKIAIVPQEFNTTFEYDVESVISTARLPYSRRFSFFETQEDKKIINQVLELVGLVKYKNKPFSLLSGGEKQKVMIARAFAQKTPILLLDEFSSHLDPGYTQNLLKLVKSMAEKERKTVLAIFHDINSAALFSDKIVVMKDGEIKYQGSPKEVFKESIMKEIFDIEVYIIEHPISKIPQILYK